jgi:precorrin-3B synthase
MLQVGVGGNAASAALVGWIAVADGAETAVRLLEVLAKRGPNARARDVVSTEGVDPFHSAIADLLLRAATPEIEARGTEALGVHRMRDESSAYGVGLAFGHADVSSLRSLVQIAERAGANGLIPAPDRILIAIGLSDSHAASEFAAQAERLGFVVRLDDPRRRVIACAGAPFCATGHIATRAIAPLIVEAVAPLRADATIHLSGCAKGCAHPKRAALTIVGSPAGCELVADGSARHPPFATVATEELPAAIAKHARAQQRETHHA